MPVNAQSGSARLSGRFSVCGAGRRQLSTENYSWKQQAVHYSSVAYALISYGKTQPQRISPLTAYPVISVSCLTGRVEIYLGVTRDAPLHDYTQTCSRCARGLMCLEFDSWGEFWAVVLHGVQTVCPELCWSHPPSHQLS